MGSAPRKINFENCIELREVAIGGEGGVFGGNGGSCNEASLSANRGVSSGGSASKDSERKRTLVLKGCTKLPDAVRERLIACILGTNG